MAPLDVRTQSILRRHLRHDGGKALARAIGVSYPTLMAALAGEEVSPLTLLALKSHAQRLELGDE